MSTTPSAKLPQIEWLRSPRTGWWLLGLGALLRITFFFVSANNGGDALARAASTAAWLQHPSLKFFFGRYLPLHFWLIGGLALLVRDPAFAGRLLSLIFGIASLFLIWILARAVYDEEAANYSLLAFSFYSLHIAYSTTSSSEVPYLFFVLAGLACFFLHRRSSNLKLLGLGGMMLSCGAAIRYEAWVVIFALLLVLLYLTFREFQKQNGWNQLRPLLVFSVTAGAWPGFWMLFVWAKMGRPFYFVNEQSASVKDQLIYAHRSAAYLLTLSPGVIVLTLSPLIIVGSLYALFLALKERSGREFSAVLIIFGLAQAHTIISGSLLPLARYTLTLGTLLVVVAGYGLQRMAERLSQRSARVFGLAIIGTVVLNPALLLAMSEAHNRFSDKFASVSPRLRFPSYIQGVGDYLHSHLAPSDAIVVDNYNEDSNILAAASGLPLLPGDRLFAQSSQDCSEVLAYMKAKHPRYVIYTPLGTLGRCLPLSNEAHRLAFEGIEFGRVFENKIYRVYEVKFRSLSMPISTTSTFPTCDARKQKFADCAVTPSGRTQNMKPASGEILL